MVGLFHLFLALVFPFQPIKSNPFSRLGFPISSHFFPSSPDKVYSLGFPISAHPRLSSKYPVLLFGFKKFTLSGTKKTALSSGLLFNLS
jgi:hypothetical protein